MSDGAHITYLCFFPIIIFYWNGAAQPVDKFMTWPFVSNVVCIILPAAVASIDLINLFLCKCWLFGRMNYLAPVKFPMWLQKLHNRDREYKFESGMEIEIKLMLRINSKAGLHIINSALQSPNAYSIEVPIDIELHARISMKLI